MTEDLTKKDLNNVRSMLDIARSVISAHEFLNSGQEIPSEIAASLKTTNYINLSKIGFLYDHDITRKLIDHYGDLVMQVHSLDDYCILSRCTENDSDGAETLRIAADEIIESELGRVIECLETLEEKIKEYLIETDSM